MNRTCDNCGQVTPDDEQMYSLHLAMYARADPLVIDLEQLENVSEQLEELLESLPDLDAEEATDEVHESYAFDLCPRCRRRFHRQLKANWLHKKIDP